jgi:putative oligomerization/nucleic acid binding protein
MRRRRPLMRAAMVGGAGYMAGKKIEQGREADAYRDQQLEDLQMQNAQLQQAQMQQAQMQQAPPPPPAAAPAAPGISSNTIEQLKQLGELHEQGILTDEEFAAQKQALLGH